MANFWTCPVFFLDFRIEFCSFFEIFFTWIEEDFIPDHQNINGRTGLPKKLRKLKPNAVPSLFITEDSKEHKRKVKCKKKTKIENISWDNSQFEPEDKRLVYMISSKYIFLAADL